MLSSDEIGEAWGYIGIGLVLGGIGWILTNIFGVEEDSVGPIITLFLLSLSGIGLIGIIVKIIVRIVEVVS